MWCGDGCGECLWVRGSHRTVFLHLPHQHTGGREEHQHLENIIKQLMELHRPICIGILLCVKVRGHELPL